MRTLIIGGGLSGLALADMLEAKGHDYMLVEARSRFGGRIKTEQLGAGYFDMGPAWFWPGQPRIAALIDRLELEKFEQFSAGLSVFEDEQGQVGHGHGIASMQGSWRLRGGLAALTTKLADRLPQTRKILNTRVTALSKSDAGLTASLGSGDTLSADQVVLALPPRIAAEMPFTPALPDAAIHTLGRIPTWMASQAKAVAVYDTPFWRDAGLSGDAMSRVGPMVEIHDASPAETGPYALFGFIGIPSQGRQDTQLLRQHLQAQLVRLVGQRAADPVALFVMDWAFESLTATAADRAPLGVHPTYGLPPALDGVWDNCLHFGASEIAPQFGGYIEGALEAAQSVLDTVSLTLSERHGHENSPSEFR